MASAILIIKIGKLLLSLLLMGGGVYFSENINKKII